MPLLKLNIPPGVEANGTKYETKGRWRNSSLVRWFQKSMGPIGGWQTVSHSSPIASNIDVSATVLATGTLTLTANAGNTETVTINAKVYTFQTVLTDTDGNVLIGATASDSIDNLIAAINLASGGGTTYAASTTVHPTVSAAVGAGDTMVATAKSPHSTGTGGNLLTTTEGLANGSWAAATLLGGTIGAVPRSMLAWSLNTGIASVLAIGTNARVYVFSQGVLTDLTPSDLTAGIVDSTFSVGLYGSGNYGALNYGTGDEAQGTLTEAGVWQLDTFGQFLVACLKSDGRILSWDADTSNDLSEVDASAPTTCSSLVVTPERFLVALGAGGDPRKVQWPDQESLTVWTATATNSAGDFILPGSGALMTGKKGKRETLLWTETSLFAMRFIGGTLIYSFTLVSHGCGIISRNAVSMVGGSAAVWMGKRSFFKYDGFVTPLPSDVSDFVFNDFNDDQRAKVVSFPISEFGEIWWLYPTADSQECDRYVTWNHRENHWAVGKLDRTSGVDRVPFDFPNMGDSAGAVYDHERGFVRDDNPAFAESGAIEIGQGDRLMEITRVIPDEKTLGDVQVSLFGSLYPTATESVTGPFAASEPTDVRVTARQVRFKVAETGMVWDVSEWDGAKWNGIVDDWRVGDFRLEARPGSRR